jgi:hypothetical protein
MRSFMEPWLACVSFAGFVLGGASLAQPPGQKQELHKGPAQPPSISVQDVVERVMAFDRNKDGKLTKDELPQRMHHLIELGDTNKDGALDRDELKKLADALARAPRKFGFGGPIRVGQALVEVKARQVRQMMDQALKQMETIMSEEEYMDFRAAVDRLLSDTSFNVRPGPHATPPGGGQKKLDPPPK